MISSEIQDFALIVPEIGGRSTKMGVIHDLDHLRDQVEAVIDLEVRPGLKAEGGDVELVGIDSDRIVQIRLLGSCQGCASSIYTMTMGIESAVKAKVPEVRFLEAVL